MTDTDDRIVVVQKFASWNVLQPQATVGTFSCSALSQKSITLLVFANDRGMNQQRIQRGCLSGKGQHQGIVKAERELFGSTCFAQVECLLGGLHGIANQCFRFAGVSVKSRRYILCSIERPKEKEVPDQNASKVVPVGEQAVPGTSGGEV